MPIKVTARPGILLTVASMVMCLALLGIVFLIGLAVGGGAVAATAMADVGSTSREVYRDGDSSTNAVIPLEGPIDGFRAEIVRLMVDDVLEDRSVRAAVLRVNSPGGSVSASDQIWHQVGKLSKSGLPVIASFGGLAASGGYYVACGADRIVAEPTTITGSIGVIAQTFIVSDLLDKVGIEPVTLLATDSPNKDLGNPMRPWTERDHQKYVSLLDAAYDIFNERVRTGRQAAISDPAQVDALADGSIYTATDALGNGLIDAIGYFDDAIAAAEKAAGLPAGKPTVIVLHEHVSLLGTILGAEAGAARGPRLDPEGLRGFINELAVPRIMYMMR